MKKYIKPDIRIRHIEDDLMQTASINQQEGGSNTGQDGGQYSKRFGNNDSPMSIWDE